jgi:hypothetical protein
MVSSVKEALNYLQQKFEYNNENQNNRSQKKASSHRRGSKWQKWNIEELGSLLDIVPDQAEQVEGNIRLKFAGAQRFFAFDNHTLDSSK